MTNAFVQTNTHLRKHERELDGLDGYLARIWAQSSPLGRMLDPIADKLLVSAALISLVQVQVLAAWMAILVIGREFAMSGLRSIAAAEGYVIKASEMGKLKLITQVLAISLLMISIRAQQLRAPALVAMWLVVLFSVLSAVMYFRKFWQQVDEAVKLRRRSELLRR